jgi:hypothetical protein
MAGNPWHGCFADVWTAWQVVFKETGFLDEIIVTNINVIINEKITKQILCSITFFRKSCHLWDNVEKYCTAGQVTDDNMAHAHCMLETKATNTNTEYVILITSAVKQWLHERASWLCYTYIVVRPVLFPNNILSCVLRNSCVIYIFGMRKAWRYLYPY